MKIMIIAIWTKFLPPFKKSLPSNKAVTESFGRVGFGAVGASVGLDVGIGAGDGVWVWVVLLVSKMGFLLVIS